ncbi:hypothetical protein [Altererythrobacter sp. Z27]|uniref:hypothetical protein n=1 Tax=Altererythrobacter sp. Z27 TaxID=3461147 RepID=UPI004044A345
MKRSKIWIWAAIPMLAACATSNPGWTGDGAVPFDTAHAACETATAGIESEELRYQQMTECMAGKGWSRG